MGKDDEEKGVGRRDFFKTVGLGTLGLGLGISAFSGSYQNAEAAEAKDRESRHQLLMLGTMNFKGFKVREITPNNEFYITSYSDKIPALDPKTYRLSIEGMVEKPYNISLDELIQMKDKTEFVTLECIGNEIGDDAIGNALWEGVTLRKVLERAVPKKGIVKTAFFAEDGYSDSIPYDLSRSDDVFLAYKMNGDPLPAQHGFPLRVIVPGIYGMKHVKWLSKIELANYDFKGYWEKRGWSDSAVIPIKSQILMPMDGKTVALGNYVIGGVAFAGRYGISRVQVSLDGGKSWKDADIKSPLSKWAWTLWRYDWNSSKEGNYTIKVRAYDRAGKVQESPSLLGRITRSFPAGAKGIHSVNVTVKKI
ncbi:MAG: molybdopterin-dependent oxidoreductase [Nitrospirota bacterium]